jgi:hypothetical protein
MQTKGSVRATSPPSLKECASNGSRTASPDQLGESVTGNRNLANGGTELNSTTEVYDLVFRNYDPSVPAGVT